LIGYSGADFYICGPGDDIAIQLNNLERDKKLQIVKQQQDESNNIEKLFYYSYYYD
jgi:hypothetical protein